MIPGGRAAMIEELRRIAAHTEDLHDRLEPYSRQWLRRLGVSDEMLKSLRQLDIEEAKRRHGQD
jgi:hypothetical protein